MTTDVPEPDQDEPTNDMVTAGVTALLATEIGAGTESEIVVRVYRAMRRAARGEPCEELVDAKDR